jgi:hypothetical protein
MLGIVRRLRQQLRITLANIALITCVFLGTIGTAQGGASVAPRESSKGASDDQQKQIAAIKSITRYCPACYHMSEAKNYGLGVVNLGPWITQTKSSPAAPRPWVTCPQRSSQ